MNIGTLDRTLALQAPAPVAQDAFGAPAPAAWQDMGTLAGGQKPGAGTEAVEAAQLTGRQVVVWQTRYRADLTTTWRFTCEGRTYQITGVAEIGRRVGLTLTTYTVDHNGQEPSF